MLRGAERIASLFRARWVLMGHTHRPVVAKVAPASSYVNLGSWGQDDPPEERGAAHVSTCTYFVIQHREGDYVGELLHWDLKSGPTASQYAGERTPTTTSH
jgi:hypothetical protein